VVLVAKHALLVLIAIKIIVLKTLNAKVFKAADCAQILASATNAFLTTKVHLLVLTLHRCLQR
jgi:hypothetical protein